MTFAPRAAAPPSSSSAPESGGKARSWWSEIVEDLRVVPERCLGAVAVVGVPVDDRDPLDPVRAGMERREGRVAEDTAAHPKVGERMMAGGSNERIRVVGVAVDDGVDSHKARAGGEGGDLVARRADGRVEASVAVPGGGQLSHALNVVGGVKPQELVVAGRPWAQRYEPIGKATHLDERLDPAHALRALGVHAGLDEPPRRDDGRGRARVVPEQSLMEGEGRPFHPALRLSGRSRPRARVAPCRGSC